jgi:AraC family transcriptional regulator
MIKIEEADHRQTLVTSEGRGWRGVQADLMRVTGGVTIPSNPWHRLCMNFGQAANTVVSCDSVRQQRVQAHGNFDLIPSGLEARVDGEPRTFLRLLISQAVIEQVSHDLDRDPGKTFLRPRLRSRDSRLENIAWAIKAEAESDAPSDTLFVECLTQALAVRLIEGPGEAGPIVFVEGQTLSIRQRKRLVEYVETHIDQPLTLSDLAGVAGISISHLKALFTRTFGISVHRYVLKARVEHATRLLQEGRLPQSEIAQAAGFSHQSHMARCIRQMTGVTPGTIARQRM